MKRHSYAELYDFYRHCCGWSKQEAERRTRELLKLERNAKHLTGAKR